MGRRMGVFWCALLAMTGCRTATVVEPTPPPVHAVASAAATPGLTITLTGAPSETTVTIEASDRRAPLVPAQPLTSGASFETPKGFVAVTLRAGDDVRLLEFYAESTAALAVVWDEPSIPAGPGITPLARAAALHKAESDLAALMAKRSDESEMVATLLEQRVTIEAMGDNPEAHLARLLHALLAVQIRGPEDAWTVVAPIPADSIAWAGFSERLFELRALFYGLPEAEARFAEVRAQVEDVGLQAAFRAGDLLAREKASPKDDKQPTSMTIAGTPEVGQPMPEFALVNLDDDTPLTNASLAGTPYLIELWSTWCSPCIESMDELHALHDEAEPRELRIVSVAVNGEKEPIVEFRSTRWPMPWTHVWAPSGTPFFEAWKIDQVPYTVLVDAAGIVLLSGRRVSLNDVRGALNIP